MTILPSGFTTTMASGAAKVVLGTSPPLARADGLLLTRSEVALRRDAAFQPRCELALHFSRRPATSEQPRRIQRLTALQSLRPRPRRPTDRVWRELPAPKAGDLLLSPYRLPHDEARPSALCQPRKAESSRLPGRCLLYRV